MTTNLFDHYRRLLNLAQAGLFYGRDAYDRERYQEIKDISLDLLKSLGQTSSQELGQLVQQEKGYPTPKVDVRAFITDQAQRILLVEDKQSKTWSLPGGYAEVGLSPKDNIRKEVLEETGLTVQVDQLLAIFDTDLQTETSQLFQYYKLVFACSKPTGNFQPNLETSAMAYFPLTDLPPLSENRTSKAQLSLLIQAKETYSD